MVMGYSKIEFEILHVINSYSLLIYSPQPTSVQSTEVSSRRVDAELEDLYFDDELCTENICRQRHLRLQSPSADTSVMPSGGAIGGTPTMTVKACSGARLQAEATGQRSSVTESGG